MAMNDPNIYQIYCEAAGAIVNKILHEIKDEIKMNDKENVLDVGCGPGINTNKNLVPFLPKGSKIVNWGCAIANTSETATGFTKVLVGSDLAEEMIEFAKRRFTTPLLTFITLDIADENLWASWSREEFTKVFSFYTMHRVPNQKKAFENMYNLLKPGGQLITVTPIENCMEQILPYLSNIPKYAEYKEKIAKMRVFLNPTQDYINDTENQLKEVGFKIKYFKTAVRTFCAPSIDYLVEFYGVVSYMSRILPADLFSEAKRDSKKIIIDNDIIEQKDGVYLQKYNVLITVAEKPN